MDATEKLGVILRDIADSVNKLKGQTEKRLSELQKDVDVLMSRPASGKGIYPGAAADGGEEKLQTFGKIIQCVYKATHHKDALAVDTLDELGVYWRAMQEDTPAEGGYLVPEEHEPIVLRIPERGVIEPRCRVIPMTSKSKNIPDETAGVTTYWVAEEGSITESQPTLGQVQITAKKQAGLVTVSNELLEDSSPNVETYLGEIFTEAMMLEFDNQLLNGTGDPVSGVLTAKAGYSVVLDSGSTSFSAIGFEKLSEAISKLSPLVLADAVFVLHPDVLHYVRILKDDQNRPIWTPAGQGPGQLYGHSIVESTKMPGAGDSGSDTAFIVFGNFRGFVKGNRRSLTVAVDPYGHFEKSQTRIRWTRRLALCVAQPKLFCRILTAGS